MDMCLIFLFFSDTTIPTLICPPSRKISFGQGDINHTFYFTVNPPSITATDLNTLNPATFIPSTLVLTRNDINQVKTITASISDIAGNTATCRFQYMAVGEKIIFTNCVSSKLISLIYDCTSLSER